MLQQNQITDDIIEEIHATRRQISERFKGDIHAIAEDAARRLAESDRPIWRPKAVESNEQISSPRDGKQTLIDQS